MKKHLINSREFRAFSKERNSIILDASKAKPQQKDYSLNEFIPGAIAFDLSGAFSETNSKYPNTLPSPEHFQSEARKLGISRDSRLLIYDCHGIFSSPRVWYLFQAMGHRDVFVLDGGLPAWKAQGYPVENKISQPNKTGDFKAHFNADKFIDIDQISKLDLGKSILLDARSPKRFAGSEAEPRKGVRSGHIPGSHNLPYSELLSQGQFKNLSELEDLFKNYAKDRELLMTCGSGVTACILALAAENLGYKDLKVFDGSWTEYGQSNYPIEKSNNS